MNEASPCLPSPYRCERHLLSTCAQFSLSFGSINDLEFRAVHGGVIGDEKLKD